MNDADFDTLTAMAFTAFDDSAFAKLEAVVDETEKLTDKQASRRDLLRAKRLFAYVQPELAEMRRFSRLQFAESIARYLSVEIAELERTGRLDSAWLRAREAEEKDRERLHTRDRK